MGNSFDSLVSHLESRYDYHSARVIAAEALKAAGLEEGKDYGDGDVKKFLGSLESLGFDSEAVASSLGGGAAAASGGDAAPADDGKAEKKAEKKEEKKEAKGKAKGKKKK